MFQSQDYHRESDKNASKYYVRDNNSGSDNRDNVSRDLLSISTGTEPSYHGRDYHYKTSYNQGRDGGYQTGSRDYSRDGGNVEYSKVTKYSEDRSPSYGGASSYAGGSGYSGTATVSRNYDSSDNDSRLYSRSDRYGDSSARNNQVQYSSSSYPSQSQSYSQSSYNRDNDRSRDQDNKGYYWQQTKTYHNDQPQTYDYPANRGSSVGYSQGGVSGSYGIGQDASRNRSYDAYDSSRSYAGSNDRSSNVDYSSRGYGGGDSGYRGNVSYSSSTGTGAGASAGGSAYSSSQRY